jgi:hypothetical protein
VVDEDAIVDELAAVDLLMERVGAWSIDARSDSLQARNINTRKLHSNALQLTELYLDSISIFLSSARVSKSRGMGAGPLGFSFVSSAVQKLIYVLIVFTVSALAARGDGCGESLPFSPFFSIEVFDVMDLRCCLGCIILFVGSEADICIAMGSIAAVSLMLLLFLTSRLKVLSADESSAEPLLWADDNSQPSGRFVTSKWVFTAGNKLATYRITLRKVTSTCSPVRAEVSM